MNNKSVIFVTGSLSDGGAEKVISILSSGCAELGVNVKLVVLRNKKIIYPVSEKVRIIQFMDKGKFAVFSRIRKLHRVFIESDADAIIPFLPIISIYSIIANIGVGKKMVLSERADPRAKIRSLSWKDKIGNFLMRKCDLLKLADWVVFQTCDAKSYYSETVQNKSSIIPNPIDTENLPLKYTGEREKRIVAAGRFSEEKNFQMLIDGFYEFQKSYPEFRLTIYGDGRLRNNYLEQIQAKGLGSFVDLPGFVPDLPSKIQKASIYVSTSNHEGISNSMLEALGMGVPTIATDCPVGGARMFINSDYNGVLIAMNDKKALVAAMKKIVADEQYAQKISNNAVKIRELLSAEHICKQWMGLI